MLAKYVHISYHQIWNALWNGVALSSTLSRPGFWLHSQLIPDSAQCGGHHAPQEQPSENPTSSSPFLVFHWQCGSHSDPEPETSPLYVGGRWSQCFHSQAGVSCDRNMQLVGHTVASRYASMLCRSLTLTGSNYCSKAQWNIWWLCM